MTKPKTTLNPPRKPKPRAGRAAPSRKLADVAPVAALAPDPLPPPPYLDEADAVIWRLTVAQLAVQGEVVAADGPTVETYVAAISRQRRIAAEIKSQPVVTDGKISPLLRVAEATAATVKNLGHVLGLNPTARLRLPKRPQTGGGKWADLD
jgi:P27 family predicted phage terminase small subunit